MFIGEKKDDPLAMYAGDVMTVSIVNLTLLYFCEQRVYVFNPFISMESENQPLVCHFCCVFTYYFGR